MERPWLKRAALAGLAVVMWACSPDEPAPVGVEPGPGVPELVTAGTEVTFPCAGTVALVPAGGWYVVGPRAFAIRDGSYRWQCAEAGESGAIGVSAAKASVLAWPLLPDAVPVGRLVDPKVYAVDVFGNRVSQALELQAEPSSATLRDHGKLRLVVPGVVTLRVRSQDGRLSSSRRVYVDAGPPRVVLSSPERGAIVRSGASGVRLRGRVLEDGVLRAFFVDGVEVPLAADGGFDVERVPARTGVHVFRYRAVDGVGNEAVGSRAVLYGPLRAPGEGLERAARVHIPRSLLDDDAPDLDDLASAVTLLAGVVQVPDQQVRFGCQGSVDLADIDLVVASVDLVPASGSLTLRTTLRDVEVDITAQACACGWGLSLACMSTSGSVASQQVQAEVVARIGANGPTNVEISRAALDLAPLRVHWSFLDGNLDWVLELFEDTIRERVVSSVEEALTTRLHGNLRDMLEAVLPLQRFTLPAPLADDVALETSLTSVSASPSGLSFDVRTRSLPTSGAAKAVRRTARMTVRASSEPPVMDGDLVGIALSLDIINDAIFELFARGSLDGVLIDLPSLGIPNPRGVTGPIELEAALPPMLLPGPGADQLSLVVGDLRLTVPTALTSATATLSFTVPARVAFDSGRNALIVTFVRDGLETHIEPASADDAATLSASFDDVAALTRRIVEGSIVGRSVVVPLPVLDLGMIRGMPVERAAILSLVDASLEVTPGGYVLASGRIRPMLGALSP